MRCFLGCEVSAQAKIALADWCDKGLRVQSATARAVNPSNFHITTLFLGNLNPRQTDSLVQLCEEKIEAAKLPPFSIALNDIRTWQKPKIVAVVPKDIAPSLTLLYKLSKQAAHSARINSAVTHDRFRPHVTVVRKILPEDVVPPVILPNINVLIDSLHLFESVSASSGVQYHKRFSWPFN